MAFEVGDADGTAGALNVTVQSSDTALLPASGVVLGGSGSARTITAMDAQQLSTSRSFRVTVNPVFVSFTGWTTRTFAVVEGEIAVSLRGFTLDGDANDVDEPFAALVQ